MKEIYEKNKLAIIMFVISALLFLWAVNKISHSMSVNVQPTSATVENTGSTRDTIIQLPDN